MTTLRRRMLEDRQRRGLAPRTQPCDVEAVTHLTPYDRRAPEQIGADELRPDCRVRRNDQQVAERTFRMPLDGIRCVSERARQRPWPVFDLGRPRPPHKLPVVLRLQEVRSRLAVVEPPNARLWPPRIDACGLRLTEGTQRQVSDLEARRRLGRGHQGPGGNDRLVPLAPRVLA
jgi:integrase/recombinase XerD